MVRTVLGVVVGFIVWAVVGSLGLFLLRLSWPDYARVEEAMTFTLAMQLSRLAVGVVSSIAAGWTAVAVARRDIKTAWALGVLLVLMFVPIHFSLWDKFPVWYHLAFLLTLAPIVGFSGRLALHTPVRRAS